MSDFVTSLIRTVVPAVIGALVAWLVRRGVNIDQAEVNAWLIPVCISGWYAFARAAETRWPSFGWLLGIPKQPGYSDAPVPPPQPAPEG